MSGVSLQRQLARCPSCKQPMTPYTSNAGTRLRASCKSWCRISRTIALARGPRPAGWEPLPADDSREPRSAYQVGAA